MRGIFADAGVTKIMHGSNNDVKYMLADLGIITVNMFDTARVYQYIQKIASLEQINQTGKLQCDNHINLTKLNKLILLLTGVTVQKQFRIADWRMRPLPIEMMEYARNDSHFLIPVYFVMMKVLNPYLFRDG